ncbi:MAG: hypothetical protein CMG89_16885 [Marinobacter sp.]|nr:hypothetical protein [Marinobacter sp.]MBP55360.1 hypothetical protein [Marinobacter sp.]
MWGYLESSGTWVPLDIDFSRYATLPLMGLALPLMLKDDLVQYKSALSRPVDLEDIRAICELEGTSNDY